MHSSGDPVSLSLVLCDATQTWPILGRSNRRWCMSRWPWFILSFRICRQHAYGRLHLKWHEMAKRTACWRDTDQHASTRAIWALPMRFCGRQEDHPRISRRPWLILSFRMCHHHAYSRLYLKWHEMAKRNACWRDTDQHASTRAIWSPSDAISRSVRSSLPYEQAAMAHLELQDTPPASIRQAVTEVA